MVKHLQKILKLKYLPLRELMRKVLGAYVFIGIFYTTSFAQSPFVVDSLINVVENSQNLNASSKYHLFYKISVNSKIPSQTIHYAKEALQIAETENSNLKMAESYSMIGEGYKSQGKLPDALEAFFISLDYFKKEDNYPAQAVLLMYIADTYSGQGDAERAIQFYNKASEMLYGKTNSFGDTLRLAGIFHNKGDEYLKINNFDSAEVYFNQSIFLYKKINYELGIAYNFGNIGLLYAKQANYNKAKEKLNEAILILEKHKDNYAISDFSHQMADIYFKNGNLQEAFPLALKSLDLAKQDGFKEQARDASLQLSELYSHIKDYEQAYHHHAQYVAYRDSINNEEVIRKMADLRTEYEVSQKQTEIDLLTEQRSSNEKIGLALLCIALLFSVLAFLFYRNNRIKRSANKLLFAQNNKLELQQTKLEALNNTKDRFFSIISHDLRGPVNAFNGISELIKYYIAHNEMGQLREVSEHIDKSARQLSSLLNNLLDWSIKQQGTFPFRPERLTLTPLLQEIVDMFRIAAHAKNITITLDVEEEINVWADRNSLATIVRNLFNNALKFTPKDGLVTLSAYTEEEFLYINIIDTGVGIPEEKVQSLFVVKEKIIDLGTEGEKGLGIGLSLALEFAEMNGGSIIVNSEEGIGSIFTLKMPLNGTELTKAKAKAKALPQSISEEKE